MPTMLPENANTKAKIPYSALLLSLIVMFYYQSVNHVYL